MNKIKPFSAVIYNQQKLADLAKVICPPYDIISPVYRDLLHERSPHNFIHVLLGKDIPGEDKYQHSGRLFQEWLKTSILVQDKEPAVYFYSQQYFKRGEKKTRLGFIALLRLPDESQEVFGHEHTRLEAKEDRFKLLKEVKANLSPIFSVFLDKKRIIQRVYQQRAQKDSPFIDVTDDDRVTHQLWRISSPELIASMQAAMNKENIFIADGHHRFEVACAYKAEMAKRLGSSFTGEEDFNYLLSYFTNTDPRGLLIMPIHRLLKLKASLEAPSLKRGLEEYFHVEEFPDRSRFFFLLEKGGQQEHLLGLYKEGKYWLLRLKNVRILDRMLSDKPKEYRCLDVCILNYIIMNKVLGLDPEDKALLEFSPSAEELIKQVDQFKDYLAFFLNPVKMEQIIAVALTGNKMPPKSTYFYPKVASGMVINKLEN
ncbi:MAG: DUF1015 domain-containing protein [Candidatus Omnitrophota bacterium]